MNTMANARMANVENDASNAEQKPYDLEERTAVFGEHVIRFARTVPLSVVTRPLVSQLVRSATSVGADYCEADDAETNKDFRHKIALCKKEARETKHWFRMIAAAEPGLVESVCPLWQEAKEPNLIFAAIRNRTGRR